MVEQCTCLNVSNLQGTIRKIANREDEEMSEQELFDFTKSELEKFTIDGNHFKFDHMKNVLGGYRWFFLCDKCGKRSVKLFLPPENCGLEHRYLCKECHKLKNESVVKANNTLYKKVIRPLKRLREIEAKLERGHLTAEKTDELMNEYDAIEKEMKSTREYRLYAFKKKRGMNVL
jgi:hypothetical protein